MADFGWMAQKARVILTFLAGSSKAFFAHPYRDISQAEGRQDLFGVAGALLGLDVVAHKSQQLHDTCSGGMTGQEGCGGFISVCADFTDHDHWGLAGEA